MTSVEAWVCAMNYLSQFEKNSVDCWFKDQLIASLPMLTKNSDVDFWVYVSQAESTLVYSTSWSKVFWNAIPIWVILFW